MKNKLYLGFTIISMLLFTTNVKANKLIINSKGATMTEQEYENLLITYSSQIIDNMEQEKIDEEKDKIYTLIEQYDKYIKTITTYNFDGSAYTTEQEITKEQYDNAINENHNNISKASTWETNYKKLSIFFYTSYGPNDNKILLRNTWKTMPKIRSNDIIAMRYNGFTKITGTEEAYLTYGYSGGYTTQSYNTNSNGFNNGGYNGSGFVMTLPTRTDVTSMEATMYVRGSLGTIYGTYQHASKEIYHDNAKLFNYSSSGLGGVIQFNNPTFTSYYDQMQGVSLSI